MVIEYGAFQNCNSLKEIHFEKCHTAINTNIYNSNIPDDLKIIVHDKLYSDFFKTEIKANRSCLLLYSEYIQEKIANIKYSNIILCIIYLKNITSAIDNNQIIITLNNIITYLTSKYQITNTQINQLQFLLDKKQEILNES